MRKTEVRGQKSEARLQSQSFEVAFDGLEIWTVYSKPLDYPNFFVVRRAVVGRGVIVTDAEITGFAETLELARELVPPGKLRIPRYEGDEPQIVECWL